MNLKSFRKVTCVFGSALWFTLLAIYRFLFAIYAIDSILDADASRIHRHTGKVMLMCRAHTQSFDDMICKTALDMVILLFADVNFEISLSSSSKC